MSKYDYIEVFAEKKRQRTYVGRLFKKRGVFQFNYDQSYLLGVRPLALGPDLPLSTEDFRSKTLFESFKDRIPSRNSDNWNRYCQSAGISPDESDAITLIGSLGRRGPSLFIFEGTLDRAQFVKTQFEIFRKKHKLSVADLAALFDVSVGTIHRLQKGEIQNASLVDLLYLFFKLPEARNLLIIEAKRLHDDLRAVLIGTQGTPD